MRRSPRLWLIIIAEKRRRRVTTNPCLARVRQTWTGRGTTILRRKLAIAVFPRLLLCTGPHSHCLRGIWYCTSGDLLPGHTKSLSKPDPRVQVPRPEKSLLWSSLRHGDTCGRWPCSGIDALSPLESPLDNLPGLHLSMASADPRVDVMGCYAVHGKSYPLSSFGRSN